MVRRVHLSSVRCVGIEGDVLSMFVLRDSAWQQDGTSCLRNRETYCSLPKWTHPGKIITFVKQNQEQQGGHQNSSSMGKPQFSMTAICDPGFLYPPIPVRSLGEIRTRLYPTRPANRWSLGTLGSNCVTVGLRASREVSRRGRRCGRWHALWGNMT